MFIFNVNNKKFIDENLLFLIMPERREKEKQTINFGLESGDFPTRPLGLFVDMCSGVHGDIRDSFICLLSIIKMSFLTCFLLKVRPFCRH